MERCSNCGTEAVSDDAFCARCGRLLGSVAAQDPLLGRALPGGYVPLELIGVGGMGRVYRGEQTALGRPVAIKFIHPYLVGEPAAQARFVTEARAASRLSHPNSVAVIAFGSLDTGQHYLVFEHLTGHDLALVNQDEGPLAFRRIIDVLRQVLAALGEAHHLGILHRDVKPENILVVPGRSRRDHVKVLDFGLAKMIQAPGPSVSVQGVVNGTPAYMSPEQARGAALDGRSDLYSVGVILFELLTGRLPFIGKSATELLLAHLAEEPPTPLDVAPERMIPVDLCALTMRALAKDPAKRFATAEEFSAALAAVGERLPLAELDPVEHLVCVACGATGGTGQKFCGECGARLARDSGRLWSLVPPARDDEFPTADGRAKTLSTPPVSFRLRLPFVGRDNELGQFLELRPRLGETCDPPCIGWVAEAGYGKTTLLEKLREQCDAPVFTVRPHPSGARVIGHTLRCAVELLAETHTLPALSDVDGVTWDGLAWLFERGPSDSGRAPSALRRSLARALLWAIRRAQERTGDGIVILIDDLDRIDGASRNAFTDALAAHRLTGLLVACACAPGAERWRGAWSRYLHPLSGIDISSLASEVHLPAGVFGPIVSPFYVEQAKHVRGPLPATQAELFGARVASAQPDDRAVLEAVAIVGDAADEGAIATLVDSTGDVAASIQALLVDGLLELRDDGVGMHPLLRAAALSTIPARRRRALHLRALEIAIVSGFPVEVRALHAVEAGDAFRALVLIEQAAAQHLLAAAADDSVECLQRGLALAREAAIEGLLEAPERALFHLGRKLAEALDAAGASADADRAIHDALTHAENDADRASVARIRLHAQR